MEGRVGDVGVDFVREESLAVRAAVSVEHQHLQVLAELPLVDVLVLLGHVRPHGMPKVGVHPRRLAERHGVHDGPERDVAVFASLVDYIGILVVSHGDSLHDLHEARHAAAVLPRVAVAGRVKVALLRAALPRAERVRD